MNDILMGSEAVSPLQKEYKSRLRLFGHMSKSWKGHQSRHLAGHTSSDMLTER